MTPPVAAPSFLSNAGWGNARIEPLAGDASFRRYFRVIDGNRKAVLMDAPPPHEDPRPFIDIAHYLTSHGFAAPEILAQDLEHGLVLIEDFGDERMREVIDEHPSRESAIYRELMDLIAVLHRIDAAELPPYDRAAYQREAAIFTEYYCPAVGSDVDVSSFIAAWDEVLDDVLAAQSPPVTVLRDYHAENIMLIDGGKRLGLLDFQDALAGHPAYDVVSMLQDARRNVDPSLEAEMLAHYCAVATPSAGFQDAYWILGAQRNTKILGIFTRLWKRDGKAHYLGFQSRVWRYLERDLAHPALAPVKAWFDKNVPAEARASFWSDYSA